MVFGHLYSVILIFLVCSKASFWHAFRSAIRCSMLMLEFNIEFQVQYWSNRKNPIFSTLIFIGEALFEQSQSKSILIYEFMYLCNSICFEIFPRCIENSVTPKQAILTFLFNVEIQCWRSNSVSESALSTLKDVLSYLTILKYD